MPLRRDLLRLMPLSKRKKNLALASPDAVCRDRELDSGTKNRLPHRGQALRQLVEKLRLFH